ncbi:hypothetical protein GCM10011297_23160 [Bacterioplanes sanyensis]|uniref:hypothetical protein n=1 Tax=Bacterioplanes sanyensis TaxID=1249553 RepID=UPI001671899A|nr:hypothetical protein [Bacterioplanes sanyensis]GGY49570.1 hypothetical protein GCM10011297_23160 [Bacterioplanes sanyensis]
MKTHITHWVTLAALSTLLAACGGSGSSGDSSTVEVTPEPDTNTEQESTVPASMDERSQLLLPTHINHRPVSWIVDTDDAPLELVKNEQGQLTLHSQDVVEDTQVELIASDTSRHTLTIKEIDAQKLPPKPKFFAARETIEGIDTDGNGVRDEVEHGLYELYGDKFQLYRATLWTAYQLQEKMEAASSGDMKRLMRVKDKSMEMVSCFSGFSGARSHEMIDYLVSVRSFVVNTDERKNAYSQYSQWVSMKSRKAVAMSKDECEKYAKP